MIEYPFINFLNIEYLFYQVYLLLTGQILFSQFYKYLSDLSVAFFPFATIFCLLASVGIIYLFIRIDKVEKGMMKDHEHAIVHPVVDDTNKRWIRVVNHLSSDNESDWRLAILEADLILEEMLNKIGYLGDTIGDKLRGVERSDFHTVDQAWEAHKVRNLIAHEGENFKITNREARRVVSLYEQVFKEFHFI